MAKTALSVQFYNFYKQYCSQGRKYICSHFISKGYPSSTVYKYYHMMKKHGAIEDQRPSHSGRKKKHPELTPKIRRLARNRNNISQRNLAKKLPLSQRTIGRRLQEVGLNFRKKRPCPHYKGGTEQEVKSAIGRLLRNHLSKKVVSKIIIDDESYIDLNGAITYGSKGYYTDNISAAPNHIKYISKQKFPPKLDFWYAVSDFGFSDIFIWRQGLAVNSTIYREECIKRRLVPFIETNTSWDQVILWPDKASAHYAKATLADLQNLQIRVVPRNDNPTCVPQARPIETIHAILKAKVFRCQNPPTNLDDLEAGLRRAFHELKAEPFPVTGNLSRKIRGLLNKCYRNGLLSIQK